MMSVDSKTDTPEKLKSACKQFEAVFVNIMLKSMRDTLNDEDDMLGSSESRMFTDMYDEKISDKISESGIGIWRSMYDTLSKQIPLRGDEEPPVTMPDSQKIIPLKKQNNEITGEKKSITEIHRIIDSVSQKFGVDPLLVRSIVQNESNFDQFAVSPVGAKGLMQLMEGTAHDMGVKNIFDPIENINGGVKYLKLLLDKFGDTATAVAAYNAGPGNVLKYGGIPPFKETQTYTSRVMSEYRSSRLKI
jgi:Rod binding domain-containing protein